MQQSPSRQDVFMDAGLLAGSTALVTISSWALHSTRNAAIVAFKLVGTLLAVGITLLTLPRDHLPTQLFLVFMIVELSAEASLAIFAMCVALGSPHGSRAT